MRRIAAMIGLVIVIGLALVLMWRVYLHHQRATTPDEIPSVVLLQSPASSAKITVH